MSSVGCRTGFGAAGFTYQDDGAKYVLRSKGISIWYVIAAMMIPLTAFVFLVVRKLLVQGAVEPPLVVACVFVPIIFLDFIGFTLVLNRRSGDGLVRFVLDRNSRTVELSEIGLVMPIANIKRFVLVRGWQSEKSRSGSSSTWALELSLLAEGDWDGLRRIHVITTGRNRIQRIAMEIANATQVPLTSTVSSIRSERD